MRSARRPRNHFPRVARVHAAQEAALGHDDEQSCEQRTLLLRDAGRSHQAVRVERLPRREVEAELLERTCDEGGYEQIQARTQCIEPLEMLLREKIGCTPVELRGELPAVENVACR